MIILDTNVLPEALKPLPSGIALRWLAAQEPSTVFTTTTTQAEVLYGVEALPPGKRRTRLQAAVEKIFAEEFEGRILPFDEQAARTFARMWPSETRLAAQSRSSTPILPCLSSNTERRRLRALRNTNHQSLDRLNRRFGCSYYDGWQT